MRDCEALYQCATEGISSNFALSPQMGMPASTAELVPSKVTSVGTVGRRLERVTFRCGTIFL